MRTLTTILILAIFTPLTVPAAIPTTGYVHDFYMDACVNPNLEIPGAGKYELTAQTYVMMIIDALNDTNTTHMTDLTTDHIVSVGYLNETLDLLHDSTQCCVDRYYDEKLSECRLCGEWIINNTSDCLGAGEYYKNGTCAPCPNGYTCPGGTPTRVPCGAGYWCENNERHECADYEFRCPGFTHTSEPAVRACADNTLVFLPTGDTDYCTDAGEYYNNGKCAACPDGYECPAGTGGKIPILTNNNENQETT